MQPRPIFAKESTSDDFTSEIEFSQEKESSDDIKIFATSDETPTIKTDVQKKTSIKETILQNGTDKIGESIEKNNNRNDPVIYYGSYTGYLTGTNDYWLYPASLSTGQYLQVQLTLPNDNNIDYDLWLLDSSFSTIKTSDYYTVTTSTMTTTLPESLGYIASSAETVYVCVYSVGGGSSTNSYTLDYVIGEENYDTAEPDENTKELTALTLSTSGATSSRIVCSPLDNDWYSFNVIDDYSYNKMRFNIESSSSTNGCSFEIYENALSNGGYAMIRKAYGTSGEMSLDAGTYYIRIISSNTYYDFDPTDIPTYTLTVVPISKVNEVEILNYIPNTSVNYGYGYKHRVEMQENISNHVTVRVRALYRDSSQLTHPARNVKLKGEVVNTAWENNNVPSMAYTESYGTTDSDGICILQIPLRYGVGAEQYPAIVSIHYVDIMELTISPYDDSSINTRDDFYYLVYTIPY